MNPVITERPLPLLVILISVLALASCGKEHPEMNQHLPSGWKAGEPVAYERVNEDPPEASEPGQIHLYGMRHGDESHRLYSVPEDTPVADIVRFFEVGSHGAHSYNDNPGTIIELVTEKATRMAEHFPCRVTFADQAGMIIHFQRPVTDDDLDFLSKLFPESEGFQSGAEAYIIEQEEGRHLFQRVQDENKFHFWWD